MNASTIVPRENLDFGLDKTMPRYWYRGDPFKTRLLDGLQISFPDGERYFISSVRAAKDRVTRPELLAQIRDFTRQEGQHGMAHMKFNDVLVSQGMPMERMLADVQARLAHFGKIYSKDFNLAITAAMEHFTAMLADLFFSHADVMEGVDPRMQALLAWHAIEEMEHKSVAFDVMREGTKIGYWRRSGAMLLSLVEAVRLLSRNTNRMLKADGFSVGQRWLMFIRNLGWLFGRKGIFSRSTPSMLAYFKPGFHPQKLPDIHNYPAWVGEYQRSGDPHAACRALLAAAY